MKKNSPCISPLHTVSYGMVTKSDCIEALRSVIDPEIGINIIDVGLIYRIAATETQIEIDYTLTSPGCPLAEVIEQDIITTLQQHTGIDHVITKLVWSPPWNIDFMSEEARLELGFPI